MLLRFMRMSKCLRTFLVCCTSHRSYKIYVLIFSAFMISIVVIKHLVHLSLCVPSLVNARMRDRLPAIQLSWLPCNTINRDFSSSRRINKVRPHPESDMISREHTIGSDVSLFLFGSYSMLPFREKLLYN